MTLLMADKISKRFNDQAIFDQVSFSVQDNEKIGLVGKNGCGKTTLFEIMAGRIAVDSGEMKRSKICRIDYIEQDKTEYLDLSLFEYVASARKDLLDMRREMHTLQQHLSTNPGDDYSLSRLGQLQSTFEAESGFDFESEVNIILAGLGFDPKRHSERIGNFSGGEKNRAGLARALAGNGNLLLLDEPTNHLDIESTMWLEEYLSKTNRSYLIISHDRTFLTATVQRVWEISFGRIAFFTGGFEKYLKERTERKKLYEHRYRHQQENIKRIQEFVRRNIAGQKTKQAQSKLKYLNRIKRLPAPRSEKPNSGILVRWSGRSFAHVLSVAGVSLGYGQTVVEQASFDIYRGDKVGLIGCNGSGKTTVLRALIGELAPMRGEVKLGANVDVAYFDQELADLNPEATVLDSLWEIDPSAPAGTIRSFLARFGFSGEDCIKLVSSLSGGEKTKLSLARLLYHPANFLIFDEPTNHLDLDSREILEKALRDFEGSCLIVSHDRYFLDRVVGRILYLNNGRLRTFDGNYSYFQEKVAEVASPAKVKDRTTRKETYLAFKEKSKRLARHKKQIQSTRSRIADLEKELGQLEEDIRSDVPKSDWERLHEASQRKQQIENQLLELYSTLEKLEKVDLV